MNNFGFIHDKLEIEILILFILNRLPEPVDKDALAELTLCDDGITYFDFAEGLGELIATDHVFEVDGKYLITEKGMRNVTEIESSVPYSVRVKAEKGALTHTREFMRSTMIKATHEERSTGGLTVNLSLSDGIDNVINMEILAGSENQALTLEKNFRKNAEHIYNAVVNILLSENL